MHVRQWSQGAKMSHEITTQDALDRFAELLHRVVHDGDAFVLFQDGQPIAELSPVGRSLRIGDLPAVLESLPRLAPEDLDAFASDLEAIRATNQPEPVPPPWQ